MCGRESAVLVQRCAVCCAGSSHVLQEDIVILDINLKNLRLFCNMARRSFFPPLLGCILADFAEELTDEHFSEPGKSLGATLGFKSWFCLVLLTNVLDQDNGVISFVFEEDHWCHMDMRVHEWERRCQLGGWCSGPGRRRWWSGQESWPGGGETDVCDVLKLDR